MRYAIFYDLETTDLNFVGQILNYAFITVDETFTEVSRLTGDIKISRTQLPEAGAVLANRVNVIAHQETASHTEPEAMMKIRKYIQSVIDNSSEKVRLIGFNSSNFDLPFLRTSMIRNGVSPYFGKNICYGDVLHASKSLLKTHKFKSQLKFFREDEPEIPSCKLEHLTKSFGLLAEDDVQLHESSWDVELTIEYASFLNEEFGLNVFDFESYTALEKPGVLVSRLSYPAAHVMLFDVKGNYSLWLDIDAYKEGKGKEAIKWYNKATSFFDFDLSYDAPEEELDIFEAAKAEFPDLDCYNYFPEKTCDIEQFIYKLKFDEIDDLYSAIWNGNRKAIRTKNASKMYIRYLLAHANLNEKTAPLLKKYAKYRYGGQMKVDRFETEYEPGEEHKAYHRKYKDMRSELEELIKDSSGEDEDILLALRDFYDSSPMKLE
jgi:hypothetical protein